MSRRGFTMILQGNVTFTVLAIQKNPGHYLGPLKLKLTGYFSNLHAVSKYKNMMEN